MTSFGNPCSGDEALEFCAGSLTGTRSFLVTPTGQLRSLMYESVWTHGENAAMCYHAIRLFCPCDQCRDDAGRRLLEAPAADMGTGCTCGFYAYWDGSLDYGDQGRVNAVVEGYGVVVIGPRGFRAQKARVVALHIPPPRPVDYYSRYSSDAVALAAAIRDYVKECLVGGPPDRVLRSRIRANYPNVPVFDTFDAMVAAYPAAKGDGQRIDPPSNPTPEGDLPW